MAEEKKMEEQIKDITCTKDLKSFQRNRYFYGKLLTVRDFEDEQRYFVEKQRLINRLIHGEGVVCGLKVEDIDGKSGFIHITPGVALDCCGREIVLPEPVEINLSEKISLEDIEENKSVPRWVTIRYDACGREPVPAYTAESSCEETCCYSRIEEGYKIEVLDEKPEECASINNELCTTWANHVANTVNGKYVDLEKKTSKWVTTGEYFNVQLRVKAKVHPMAITIEPSESEEFEIDEKTFPSGVFDFQAGEEKTFVYKVKSLATDEQNLTEGKISAEIEHVSGEEEHDFPSLTINAVYNPDEETNKAFINIHQEACFSSKDIPVLLAGITVTKKGELIKVLDIDNAILEGGGFDKKLVYSNPRLYELIKCVEQQVELQEPREQEFEKDFPKIKTIDWEHNKEYDLLDESDEEEFNKQIREGFTITFVRDMKKETINHKTLNVILIEYTFEEISNYGYVEYPRTKSLLPVYFLQKERKEVSFTVIRPDIGDASYWAVDRMVKTKLQAASGLTVALGEMQFPNVGFRALIRLKGDFIQDVDGNPLDANHINGELPTGNGTLGGLFESWIDAKLDYSNVDNAKKGINIKPGSSVEEVAKIINLTKRTTHLILNALAKNHVIYYSKEAKKYYPLPDPTMTMIVYDRKYNYLKESAEKLSTSLKERGIVAKIKSTDELTDEDKKKYEIILLRGGDVTGVTKEKISEVKSKIDWSKSIGDTEIVKNPYIKDTNVFIIGGKDKVAIDKAVNDYLKRYTSPEVE